MRISDWSSDVCSSDLDPEHLVETLMRVFLQVSAHDFNEFRICLPLRPDRTSRRPDANDLIGPGMANAVSGSGSGGEERPPARLGFKLLDDGSGNPDLAFRVLHQPSQDGGLVLQAFAIPPPIGTASFGA